MRILIFLFLLPFLHLPHILYSQNPGNNKSTQSLQQKKSVEICDNGIDDDGDGLRWGNRIFSTTNLSSGWDGNLNGKPKGTDVYVWLAQYRKLPGGPLILKKGTVTLIK